MPNSVSEPLLTISIPTYKSADRFLRNTIESALAQSYENVEVLVSDNGSPDHTEEVVRSYSAPQLRYIRHEPALSVNEHFNFCITEARGKYTLLLHDDDLIEPDFLSICMERAAGGEPGFIRTGVRIIDPQGATLRERENVVEEHTIREMYRAWFSGSSPWYYCNTLFHREALLEVGGFNSPGRQLEDGFAVVRLAARGDWVDVPEVLASFRASPEQRTFNVPVREWCEDYSQLLEMMCAQIDGDIEEFQMEAKHCFGKRCRRRAEARSTLLGRLMTGIIVMRFFGPRYYPWGKLERVWARAFGK